MCVIHISYVVVRIILDVDTLEGSLPALYSRRIELRISRYELPEYYLGTLLLYQLVVFKYRYTPSFILELSIPCAKSRGPKSNSRHRNIARFREHFNNLCRYELIIS
jgi:hypothetical protein